MQPFGVNQAEFLDVALESASWGIYCVVFSIYIRDCMRNKDRGHNAFRIPLIILFIFCTSFAFLDITAAYFILFATTPEEMRISNNGLNWSSSIFYSLADCLSQAILMYRCYVVWGRRWGVVWLPAIFSLASLAIGLFLTFYAVARPNLASEDFPTWFFTLGTAGFSFSLVTNAVVACTLIARLFTMYSEVKSILPPGVAPSMDIRPVMAVLIESGLLMFVGQLLWVVLFSIQNPAFGTVVGPITQIYGITPTLVAVRVALGKSYHETSHTMSLRFVRSQPPDSAGSETMKGNESPMTPMKERIYDIEIQ